MAKKEIDYSWRPETYFSVLEREQSHYNSILGTARREMMRSPLGLSGELRHPVLDPQVRQDISRVGSPALLSGEFLEPPEQGEVEIARIWMNSTTGDVICMYARPDEAGIRYRVVDEYDKMTISGPGEIVRTRTLTLRELVDFFTEAGSITQTVYCNWESPKRESLTDIVAFFSGSSAFYPEFSEALTRYIKSIFERSR